MTHLDYDGRQWVLLSDYEAQGRRLVKVQDKLSVALSSMHDLRDARDSLTDRLAEAERDADSILVALRLDPERYRTECGYLNVPKICAAIKHPDQYPHMSASDRLHNLCAALEQDLNDSPFTRDEWARMDKEIVECRNAYDALRAERDEAEALLRDSQHLLGDGPACDDHHIKVRAFLAKLEDKP